jgi:translation initiation factor IF-3
VRVVLSNGEQLGVMPTKDAITLAGEKSLDLVEIAPTAIPPVCKIMDYGKYKYEESKKERQARKKLHTSHLKELTFRPKIEEHDYQVKLRHAREFLEAKSKLRATMRFRGREITHMELGEKIIKRFIEDLSDLAVVEQNPKREGKRIVLLLSPKSKK